MKQPGMTHFKVSSVPSTLAVTVSHSAWQEDRKPAMPALMRAERLETDLLTPRCPCYTVRRIWKVDPGACWIPCTARTTHSDRILFLPHIVTTCINLLSLPRPAPRGGTR